MSGGGEGGGRPASSRKRLILSADDFGLAVPVNEAVELAHRDGVLGAASLMVAGPAVDDAVERARRLPSLRVGLHLVVVEGPALLPPERISALVDARGDFPADLVGSGLRFFFRPEVRRQLRLEIRAQFEAFRATGLELDHVNAHNHMHLHPTVLGIVLEVGRAFDLRAVRIPRESVRSAWTASGAVPWRKTAAVAESIALAPWIAWLRRRLRRSGLQSNDRVVGLADTGFMDEETVLRRLRQLPDGVSEMYFHVATRRCAEIDRSTPEYWHERELEALRSPRVRRLLEEQGIERTTFGALARSRERAK